MSEKLPLELELDLLENLYPDHRYEGEIPFPEWQEKTRTKLMELLKLPSKRCDDKLEIECERETEAFREIRFKFQSEEGYFVPCVLRIPIQAKGPVPVVICLQGHSKGMHISLGEPRYPDDEISIKNGDRDFANRVIEEGFCALAIEQRGMGIRGGDEKGPRCHIATMTALLNGRTILGLRVWDVSRAIDILERHFPQTDTEFVMCLGNSGGGTTTFYAACLDERIKLAIPSCAVCTYKDSIASLNHCVCNFVPDIGRHLDMGDLAGLIAPRKLVVVSGMDDDIFPLHGVMETDEIIKKMYRAALCPDHYSLVIGNGGHRFYADDAWKEIRKMILKRCIRG